MHHLGLGRQWGIEGGTDFHPSRVQHQLIAEGARDGAACRGRRGLTVWPPGTRYPHHCPLQRCVVLGRGLEGMAQSWVHQEEQGTRGSGRCGGRGWKRTRGVGSRPSLEVLGGAGGAGQIPGFCLCVCGQAGDWGCGLSLVGGACPKGGTDP